MIIENVLARIEQLERELSVTLDRLDALEKRGPITTQAPATTAPKTTAPAATKPTAAK